MGTAEATWRTGIGFVQTLLWLHFSTLGLSWGHLGAPWERQEGHVDWGTLAFDFHRVGNDFETEQFCFKGLVSD